MGAWRLADSTEPAAPEELAGRGVLSWSVPIDESARADVIGGIAREHGYVDRDFVELRPDTPNLEAVCAKLDREHHHSEDEVRFVVAGEGIFDGRDELHEWVRIEVTEGDTIVIPARTHHRFFLTDAKRIRCMRLFADHDGWAPLYRQ